MDMPKGDNQGVEFSEEPKFYITVLPARRYSFVGFLMRLGIVRTEKQVIYVVLLFASLLIAVSAIIVIKSPALTSLDRHYFQPQPYHFTYKNIPDSVRSQLPDSVINDLKNR